MIMPKLVYMEQAYGWAASEKISCYKSSPWVKILSKVYRESTSLTTGWVTGFYCFLCEIAKKLQYVCVVGLCSLFT